MGDVIEISEMYDRSEFYLRTHGCAHCRFWDDCEGCSRVTTAEMQDRVFAALGYRHSCPYFKQGEKKHERNEH